MELDLSASSLINAGGALLFVLVGAGILAVASATRRGLLLGATAVTFGLTYIVENVLVTADGSPLATGIIAACAAPSAALVILLAVDVARGLPRGEARLATAFAVAGGGVFAAFAVAFLRADSTPALLAAAFPPPGGLGTVETFAVQAQQVALVVLLAILGLRARSLGADRRSEQEGLAAIALAFGPFLAFLTCGAGLAVALHVPGTGPTIYNFAGLALGILAVLAMSTFATTRRDVGPRTRFAYPVLFLASVAGLALILVNGVPFHEDYGGYGLARTVGAAVLAHAILRANLLGVPLRELHVSRAAAATGALATLFVVAEVAQNFFAAEYGLLTGGVVAGVVLFVAQPLQRAAERVGTGTLALARRAPDAPDRRAELYRRAVRFAIREGGISAEEELHLFEVAEELGVGAGEAMRIRREIEREAGRGA